MYIHQTAESTDLYDILFPIFLFYRQHPKVRLSLAISRHFLDNNFIRLFRMTRKLSALEKCALFPHMTSIRRYQFYEPSQQLLNMVTASMEAILDGTPRHLALQA